jgi:hypothetical protein
MCCLTWPTGTPRWSRTTPRGRSSCIIASITRSTSPARYQHAKGDWVTAFWKVVNWEDAAQRFQKVRTLDLAL